ncbi:MAG: hypothetical protein V8S77_08465 [Oscillospiraceae bacterium]
MKKLRECENDTLLVALLLAGILMVMGAYRIFSYLCENARMERRYLPAGRGLRPAGGGWFPAGTGQLPAAEGAASGAVGISFGGSLVWSLVKGSEI